MRVKTRDLPDAIRDALKEVDFHKVDISITPKANGVTKLIIEIEMGNERMQTRGDFADACERVVSSVRNGHSKGSIRDANGNTVGTFELQGEVLREENVDENV